MMLRIGSLVYLCALTAAVSSHGANVTWIGLNADWTDGIGNNANWSPADEPDPDDTAIFNTANVVNMASSNSVLGLTMSGGIDLSTNTQDLVVDGLVQLSGSSTNLFVSGSGSLLTADSVTINNLANLEMAGGAMQVIEEAGLGLLDINAGGVLSGFGTVNMNDGVVGATTLIVNDGTIAAQRAPLVLFGAPQVGTLTFAATDVDARIDLDGAAEAGAVLVRRNQTLDINLPLADSFAGSMSMFHDSLLDIASAWTMNGGTLNVDNGFIAAVFPNPSVPAGTSIIAGGAFTQTGGTITVVDADGRLEFDAIFQANAGSLVNNGHVVFNNVAVIGGAANMTMPTTSSRLTVGPNATVDISQGNFNLDGANSLTNVITVETGGSLNIATTDYDPDQATNAFDGTITIESGAFTVNTSDAEFVMDGTLNINKTTSAIPFWSSNSEPLDIGNDSGALDADVNIGGTGISQINAQVDFNSDADVNIAAGATLQLVSQIGVNFNTVNGGNNAEFTGAGTLSFEGPANVNEAVTLNMVGGTVDLDGNDGVGDFINIDAPLTINVATLGSFGRINGMGSNTLDVNNSVGTGVLTVNLDNAAGEWTLNAPGVMNLVNDNTEATLLAGSDVNVNGTVNVTGDVRTTARLDIGSTAVVNINTGGQPLRLAGGNNTDDPNTIGGGTISGAGLLGADTGKALQGFGTINSTIDFDGDSDLVASGGMLDVNGSINDVGTLRTSGGAAVLELPGGFSTNVTDDGILMAGGTVQGGSIAIAAPAKSLRGFGTVTNLLDNNGAVEAQSGTLILNNAASDYDGTAGGVGQLRAGNNAILEIQDNATFGFTGTVAASGGARVYTNGFALDFNPGSSMNLATGGKYQSTNSTDLGGTVTVGLGGATIEVENNSFLSFEPTSATNLFSNLTLLNNNIIVEDGATFSGGSGALVVPDGSNMVIKDQADVGVLLEMSGGLRPGNSEGIGRVNLFDYQQYQTGELFVELRGTSLNQFDRIVASGDVVLDGYLSIDIDEVSPGVQFVPALGNTFNIITGNTVTGQFDFADVSGMPAGLAMHIAYLPNAVQLQVVNKPIFSADFDEDGDVDSTDLAIWDGAYNLNQLGDADGDNDSDGNDFLLWQRQLGSKPATVATVPTMTAVPEPSAVWLLLVAASPLGASTGRRRFEA